MLEREGPARSRTDDDADFEAELAFERRAREIAGAALGCSRPPGPRLLYPARAPGDAPRRRALGAAQARRDLRD